MLQQEKRFPYRHARFMHGRSDGQRDGFGIEASASCSAVRLITRDPRRCSLRSTAAGEPSGQTMPNQDSATKT